MANLPPYPGSNRNTSTETYSTPRWVKVFGVIVMILILVFIILHLMGYGFVGHTL